MTWEQVTSREGRNEAERAARAVREAGIPARVERRSGRFAVLVPADMWARAREAVLGRRTRAKA